MVPFCWSAEIGREEDFKLAQLFMFQAMCLLAEPRPEWPAKMQREKLHLGERLILDHINQLKL